MFIDHGLDADCFLAIWTLAIKLASVLLMHAHVTPPTLRNSWFLIRWLYLGNGPFFFFLCRIFLIATLRFFFLLTVLSRSDCLLPGLASSFRIGTSLCLTLENCTYVELVCNVCFLSTGSCLRFSLWYKVQVAIQVKGCDSQTL